MRDFEAFERLFQELRALPSSYEGAEQTFLQVCGYPHYENVCSNLLAFFVDSGESHGFGDLAAKSLLECAGVELDPHKLGTETVERECLTAKGNRIDLVFETEKLVVAVENKVKSSVHNDLADYQAYAEARARAKGKEAVCLLLSLRDNAGAVGQGKFVNIMYRSFLTRLRMNLGPYVAAAPNKWLVFLNDFTVTLAALEEEKPLDRELVEFFRANWQNIEDLLEAKNSLQRALKQRAQKIRELVSVEEAAVKEYVYASQNKCYAEYYIEFDQSRAIEGQIVLSAYVDLEGGYIIAGVRGDSEGQKQALAEYFAGQGIGCESWRGDSVYMQLEKYDAFAPEAEIGGRFKELLHMVLSS